MRDVADAKRRAHMAATNRIIDKNTAIKEDLILCVKEKQKAIAEHIIVSKELGDVVDIRGVQDFKKLVYIR